MTSIETEEFILQYVDVHPRTSEYAVIHESKKRGKGAPDTIISAIDRLSEGVDPKIIVKKDPHKKYKSAPHYLYINDKNEFNIISHDLVKMKKIIETLPVIEDAVKRGTKTPRKGKIWLPDEVDTFLWMILKRLLRVKAKIHSEKDAQTLNNKIIELIIIILTKKAKISMKIRDNDLI